MIPVGKFIQEIVLIEKDQKGGLSKRSLLDVVFF